MFKETTGAAVAVRRRADAAPAAARERLCAAAGRLPAAAVRAASRRGAPSKPLTRVSVRSQFSCASPGVSKPLCALRNGWKHLQKKQHCCCQVRVRHPPMAAQVAKRRRQANPSTGGMPARQPHPAPPLVRALPVVTQVSRRIKGTQRHLVQICHVRYVWALQWLWPATASATAAD